MRTALFKIAKIVKKTIRFPKFSPLHTKRDSDALCGQKHET